MSKYVKLADKKANTIYYVGLSYYNDRFTNGGEDFFSLREYERMTIAHIVIRDNEVTKCREGIESLIDQYNENTEESPNVLV